MNKHSLLFIVAIMSLNINFSASAEHVILTDSKIEYIKKTIKVENVKGVEVRLSIEIVRDDCNRRAISVTKALVSGHGDGWYDTYILDAGISQTLKHCPLDNPVKETIYSEPLYIESFTNEYVKGNVIVSFIIPKEYKLEAVAVRLSI